MVIIIMRETTTAKPNHLIGHFISLFSLSLSLSLSSVFFSCIGHWGLDRVLKMAKFAIRIRRIDSQQFIATLDQHSSFPMANVPYAPYDNVRRPARQPLVMLDQYVATDF